MRKRESFNDSAELYDEVRPSYPDEMYEWIIRKSKLNNSCELLEIAPGTGQCTKPFIERGYKIHSVELGDKLAALLMRNMKNKEVTVDVSSFEDWQPPSDKLYQLIYCATAWHWIDPKVKYQKTFDLLESDGKLAIIWNSALGFAKNEIMDKAYDLLFSYHDESINTTKPKTIEEVKVESMSTKGMIEESGHFLLDDYYEETWSLVQSKKKAIKGFFSQSSFLSLNEDEKTELRSKLDVVFSDLEDELVTYFKSVVFLCKKNI